MATPYIGEIRMFGGSFAINGWAFCNGQLMAISQNEALFQLIGTTYGGDGQTTFALPDLRGRIPLHVGSGFQLGQIAGSESVTLTTQQLPSHNHAAVAIVTGASNVPTNNMLAGEGGTGSANVSVYYNNPAAPTQQSIAPGTIGSAGGSQPHDNMVPYLVVNFIIALFGVFPTQN
jgi:microcystin-dependent protein